MSFAAALPVVFLGIVAASAALLALLLPETRNRKLPTSFKDVIAK